MRTPRDQPVDALALDRVRPQRRVLEHGPLGARGQQRHALLGVPGVLQDPSVEPVVGDLVVVPLHVLRDGGVEASQRLVLQVVAIAAAKLLEGLGHLRLLGRHDVAPGAAATGQRDLGLDRTVGVDHVAAVDEEIRLQPAHRLVDLHPAPLQIDPPPLPRGVAGPHERHVASVGGRGLETAGDRRADGLEIAEVLEAHPIEDVLAGGQAGEHGLGGEAGLREGRGAEETADVAEPFGRCILDEQPGRTIGRTPDHRSFRSHVAALDAERHGGAAIGGLRDGGARPSEGRDGGHPGQGGVTQKRAASHDVRHGGSSAPAARYDRTRAD